MKIAPLPENEAARLEALNDYQILDTLPEPEYDDLARIAAHICQTPIALISLIDERRQWFKSAIGMDATESSRDRAFCAHALLQKEIFIVPDSLQDERFHDNPLVTEAPHVRFYAGAPLETPSGQRIGTICVVDHTPKHLSDEQINALQALSRQVVSLLELRTSQRKDQKALKAKSRFLATMSHEIRTPMNAVLSCTNLLLDTVKKPQNVKLLKTIQNSGDMLLNLINDILDFSKIESNKIQLENEPYDLHDNTQEIIELLNASASGRGVTLSCNLDASVPIWVTGDATRFRQILTNLIGNAIKFTQDKVEVKAKAIPLPKGEHEVQFSVIDNGVGISPEEQQHLFQDFSQADASTNRKFGGTGLGLAICKGIINAMKGEIWAESEFNRGATFSFLLTIPSAEAPKMNTKERLIKINPLMATKHPLRILMAEDNHINQMVAKKLFEKIGYRIDVVANGLEAIDSLKKYEYDIIFMDQHMPIMDGVEATKRIRSVNPDRPKIFAVTASVFDEDRERCVQAGMNGFLTKPIKVEKIIDALLECKPNLKLKLHGQTEDVIDMDGLYAQFEGDLDILGEMTRQCSADIPGYMENIKASIDSKDAKSLASSAHTLKGMIANFHADPVVESALNLEIIGRKGDFTEAHTAFRTLEGEIEKLKPYFQDILDHLK